MSHHIHRQPQKRDAYLPISGSIIASVTPTASTLAQNTAAVSDPGSVQPGVPLVSNSVISTPSTGVAQSTTPTANTNSSASSSNQIPLGVVIGSCVAALVAFFLAVALAVYCSKRRRHTPAYSRSRNAANNASRRRSRQEAWKRMEDKQDRWEDKEGRDERSMRQRPPSGPLGAMFHRTNSNASGEKSSEGHNRESVGTMQHFAKYHPGLAAEMAAQGTEGVDKGVAKPQPVLRFVGRGTDMTPPISWDGETIGGDSFHGSQSNQKSPCVVATAKATPPATISSLHHWERAEVVHIGRDSDVSEAGERNPFSDSASSVKSRRSSSSRGRNPFFGGQDHHHFKRPLPPELPKNPFADANSRDSASAIRSLIAALEEPQRLSSNDRIISLQSSVYSRATDDGDSAISVTAFPYPPAQVNLR